jgi:outer membrane lipoprotein carrier protein
MKKNIIILLSIMCGYVSAQSSSDLLQDKLNAISTMTADFKQVVKAKKREVSRSSGTMALQRPGRFRWKTLDPMEQLIVADGSSMWVYDVDLEQVTVKKQEKGLGGTAALFLSGYDSSVAKDFEVSEHDQGGLSVFDLRAKASKENFQQIKLIFSKERLVALELYDQLGQVTTVKLVNVKMNTQIANNLFKFSPPKGVDVIKQ